MRDLDNTVAWVSGGGTGIGQAGAMALAQAGAMVVITGRRQESLEETVKLIHDAGGKADFETLDIGEKVACREVAAQVIARHGKVDILVNNAAMNIPNRFWNSMEDGDWEDIVNVNINGAYYCIDAVLPQMRERGDGQVINITSWAGVRETFLSGAAYTTSKTAMIAMSNTLNMEEGHNGIRSTSIAPAEVATAFAKQRTGGAAEGAFDIALQPDDLGETIAFVAQLPRHACINEIVISPSNNRWYENNRRLGN